jgi:hypothetical protein
VVDVSQIKRPTRVVMVDADNPMEEVRGEFFWREDHERVVAAARDEAYRAGYEDGLAALDELTNSTTDIAADLVTRLEELADTQSGRTTVRSWCWRDLGPKAEEELWSQLTDWVDWLRGR